MSSSQTLLAPTSKHDQMAPALLIAIAVHAVIVLGISFDLQRSAPPALERTLDITLVTPKPPEEVEDPDFLAQSSQQGGGEETIKERPSSPLGNPESVRKTDPAPELKQAGAIQPEPKIQPQVITREDSARTQVVRPPIPEVPAQPAPELSQLLASTQLEIDRLTAELDRRTEAASKRDRRKAINASTQEAKYAAYLDGWRKKVERIGNLNYPDEAKRKKLYGALLLHVAVRADGSIEQLRLVRSSGHKVLDDAAMRIVRLSAPFAPFPPNIREEIDVLDITRTWQFRNGNQLFSTR